jgi:hypothetical protein
MLVTTTFETPKSSLLIYIYFILSFSLGLKMFRSSTLVSFTGTVMFAGKNLRTYSVTQEDWNRGAVVSARVLVQRLPNAAEQLVGSTTADPNVCKEQKTHVLPQVDVKLKVNKNKQLGGVRTDLSTSGLLG